ncbi:MAG: Mth938-like domain-containing protein [Burkholderiaceae bacterium]
MKLHQDQPGALNTVTAYGAGYIEINAQRHQGALKVTPDGEIESWSVTGIEDFNPAAVSELLAGKPEIILLGTGVNQRFPEAATLAELYRSQTGFEVMSTPAACRTYNILMAEGRQVLAALMPLTDGTL